MRDKILVSPIRSPDSVGIKFAIRSPATAKPSRALLLEPSLSGNVLSILVVKLFENFSGDVLSIAENGDLLVICYLVQHF